VVKNYMIKTNANVFLKRISCGILAVAMLLLYYPNIASADPITGRTVTIGSSVASASTTYSFTFTVPQSTVIKSASFTACTTASDTCTPAPGFSASTSTLTAQPTNLGDAAGWTVNTLTANSLRLSKTGNVAAPTGSQTVGFSGVTNPSATNSTFFLRISTFSDDAYTTPIDAGVVASSTAGQITVTASVDETLTFTLATATVALGTLSTSATGTGTSSITVATNAASGYSVAYSGDTLSSGSNEITAIATAADSATDTKQFGINLMNNTTPDVGADKTGAGSGTPSTGYEVADHFQFKVAGDTIATASAPTNSNVFTTSYIANINGSTAAGAYSTDITYTATANF
jgi:hypothetical protein